MNETRFVLSGLDGANPLAFLAALGTLRTLNAIDADSCWQMAWQIEAGAWRPELRSRSSKLDCDELCNQLAEYLSPPPQLPLLDQIGDDLNMSPTEFRALALDSISHESTNRQSPLRTDADYLAAFGSDGTYQPHSKDHSQIQDTGLRTMSGAGHQHFIQFMRKIIENTEQTHLYQTLFERWKYQDEGRGLNLRWDPIDDRRYAMRWKNPSADPNMTMRGANRLAIEALPWFPTAPQMTTLHTTGFKTIRREGTFLYWPLWSPWLSPDAVRCLLQHPGIIGDASADCPRGVTRIYRSQRITVGKFRNFTPGVPVDK